MSDDNSDHAANSGASHAFGESSNSSAGEPIEPGKSEGVAAGGDGGDPPVGGFPPTAAGDGEEDPEGSGLWAARDGTYIRDTSKNEIHWFGDPDNSGSVNVDPSGFELDEADEPDPHAAELEVGYEPDDVQDWRETQRMFDEYARPGLEEVWRRFGLHPEAPEEAYERLVGDETGLFSAGQFKEAIDAIEESRRNTPPEEGQDGDSQDVVRFGGGSGIEIDPELPGAISGGRSFIERARILGEQELEAMIDEHYQEAEERYERFAQACQSLVDAGIPIPPALAEKMQNRTEIIQSIRLLKRAISHLPPPGESLRDSSIDDYIAAREAMRTTALPQRSMDRLAPAVFGHLRDEHGAQTFGQAIDAVRQGQVPEDIVRFWIEEGAVGITPLDEAMAHAYPDLASIIEETVADKTAQYSREFRAWLEQHS